MTSNITINGKDINQNSEPYIIAEIGVNHGNSLDLALELVTLAKKGGASAAKFQTYKANKLASANSPAYWDTTKEKITNQRDLFAQYDHFGETEFIRIAEHCQSIGIDFMSTPFDLEAVDFLNELVPCFKIASADITNIPLLRRIASKQKPVIMSTGAADLDEIHFATRQLQSHGAKEIALLHCVLNYPTLDENATLQMISGLRSEFPEHVIGYSDHTLPHSDLPALQIAYLYGAAVLEKHFTHDKTLEGNDHYHAMDVSDLENFKARLDRIIKMKGKGTEKFVLENENLAIQNARRSIVLNQDVKMGETLTEEKLICKRPGFGISPVEWDNIVGKKVIADLKEDHILNWSDIIQDK